MTESRALSFAAEYLRRALERGRLSHAYLFLGPEGSGRKAAARLLAKALFCRHALSRPQTAGACTCPSCGAIDHENHADVDFFRPPADAVRGAVDIEQVRELAGRVHLRRTGFYVAIVESADRMAVPAANALLKTLEEPTGSAVIILLAQSLGALLPTLVSRCHRLAFSATAGDADGALVPEVTLSRVLLDALARDAASPSFYAAHHPREWLTSLFPEETPTRDALRHLVDALLANEHKQWSPLAEPLGLSGAADPQAERLEALLELSSDLDANVHVEVVLNGVLKLVRSHIR